jgi:hypothetical protein
MARFQRLSAASRQCTTQAFAKTQHALTMCVKRCHLGSPRFQGCRFYLISRNALSHSSALRSRQSIPTCRKWDVWWLGFKVGVGDRPLMSIEALAEQGPSLTACSLLQARHWSYPSMSSWGRTAYAKAERHCWKKQYGKLGSRDLAAYGVFHLSSGSKSVHQDTGN